MKPIQPVKPMRLIGLGQPLRGDDALGLEALRQLRPTLPAAVRERLSILALSGEAASLYHHLQGAEQVLILDAIQTGAPPGQLVEVNAVEQILPRSWQASTHSFGLAEALELCRALNELPPTVRILGLTPSHFDTGSALSEPVVQALPKLIQRAQSLLNDWSTPYA